jgi:hypothetical protein
VQLSTAADLLYQSGDNNANAIGLGASPYVALSALPAAAPTGPTTETTPFGRTNTYVKYHRKEEIAFSCLFELCKSCLDLLQHKRNDITTPLSMATLE